MRIYLCLPLDVMPDFMVRRRHCFWSEGIMARELIAITVGMKC